MPRMPEPPRRRDLTPLSPIAGPVHQPPKSWRHPDGYAGEETKTPAGSMDRRMLAAVVASFDPLSTQHRLDLAEIGGIFADIEEAGGRERFLALARTYGNTAQAARAQLLELVLLASEMSATDRAALIRLARALPERDVEIDVAVVE